MAANEDEKLGPLEHVVAATLGGTFVAFAGDFSLFSSLLRFISLFVYFIISLFLILCFLISPTPSPPSFLSSPSPPIHIFRNFSFLLAPFDDSVTPLDVVKVRIQAQQGDLFRNTRVLLSFRI